MLTRDDKSVTRSHPFKKARKPMPQGGTGGGESLRPFAQLTSRWPSNSGGSVQSRPAMRDWCNSSTGFQFSEHRC
jgi:hypothetical protein